MTLLSKNWTLASFSLTVLSSPYWPWMPSLGVALVCPVFLLLSFRFAKYRTLGGVVLAVLMIVTHGNVAKTQSSSIFQAGQDITIKGKVDSLFKQISFGYEGSVVVNQINGQSTSFLFPPKIRLFSPVSMQLNDEFEYSVTVKPVIGRLNQVGFDLESHYMSQGWVAKATVKSGSAFKIISKSNLRAKIYQQVKAVTQNSPYQGMIMALVFGERSDVSHHLWQQLRDSGLIHLVAISGLHIGIAFGVGYIVGSLCLRLHARFLWAPFIIGVIFAIGYAWLAGFTVPTQRALTMCLINAFVIVTGITLTMSQRVLLTLSAVLLIDPFASLSMSFWLSFIAVAIVIYLFSVTVQIQKTWLRLIIAQLMLVLLMAPVSIYFFGGVSWLAVLFNLVFIPWFSFVVVPMLFLAVCCSYLSFPLSEYLWGMVYRVFDPLLWALQYSSKGWLSFGEEVQQLLLISVLSWLARSILSAYSMVFLAMVLSFNYLFKQSSYDWRMDILDVGHGLAIIIEKNGRYAIYDTGSSWREGSYVDSVIAPLLNKRGATELDFAIYSHLDNDHAGGRYALAELFPPKVVYTSQYMEGAMPCIRGEKWQWQGLSFSVLWPPERVKRAYNQHSCVIRVEEAERGHSILLSGDVTAVGEWLLARGDIELKSDVMVVPHHGSNTSSTGAFIERVNPKLAIASLAKDNRWNLPNPKVVERYRNRGAKWIDTGESGQVMLEYRSEILRLSTMRSYWLNPWYRQMLRKGVE